VNHYLSTYAPLAHNRFGQEVCRIYGHLRARKWGAFLACRALAVELHNPHTITDDQLELIFGRIPGTRTPPRIEKEEFEDLLALF
jgi:hypothetical protein